MCIADYLGKGYLPLEIPTYEKEVNKSVTDSKFCKGFSRRAKYCYRDVSRDNLIQNSMLALRVLFILYTIMFC